MDLRNIDFLQDEETFSISKIALPDEMPRAADRADIPHELLKSTTVENLISQNEDLMGRLKVALRRLSSIELENQKLTEQTRKAVLSQTALKDQVMIFKEKDHLWKNKTDALEASRQFLETKANALEEKVAKLSAAMDRHTKYQEKIRTQVKPYIAQLKEFSIKLQEDLNKAENQSNSKEALISDLRNQIIEISKASKTQIEIQTKKNEDLTSFYESQIDSLQRELESLKEIRQDHDFKTLKLNKALERQDWLENEVIQISRSKEELKLRMEDEVNSLQARIHELNRQNQRLGMEHADLQVKVVDDSQSLQKLKTENEQLREQLEGLRYMWTAKNEETEKLKTALSGLERLNVELSQRINNLREQKES